MTRHSRAVAFRTPATNRLVTWFVLLAFFLQSLAVQTHIHPLDQIPTAKLAASLHTPVPKLPAKNTTPVDQCRLCQELLQAGSFITPAAALLAAPTATIQIIPLLLLPIRALSAPAFAWQSRAPPKA